MTVWQDLAVILLVFVSVRAVDLWTWASAKETRVNVWEEEEEVRVPIEEKLGRPIASRVRRTATNQAFWTRLMSRGAPRSFGAVPRMWHQYLQRETTKLDRAGWGDVDPQAFLARKCGSALLGAGFVWGLGLLYPIPLNVATLAVGGITGWAYQELRRARAVATYRKRCYLDIQPFLQALDAALDQSGQGLFEAIAKATTNQYGSLFREYHKALEVRSRGEAPALMQVANRVDLPEIRNLNLQLLGAKRTGGGFHDIIAAAAASNQRDLAFKIKAAEAPIKGLGALIVTFLGLPAVGVFLIAMTLISTTNNLHGLFGG